MMHFDYSRRLSLADFDRIDWRQLPPALAGGYCARCCALGISYLAKPSPTSRCHDAVCDECGWSFQQAAGDLLGGLDPNSDRITQHHLAMLAVLQMLSQSLQAVRGRIRESLLRSLPTDAGPLQLLTRNHTSQRLTWSLVQEILGDAAVDRLRERIEAIPRISFWVRPASVSGATPTSSPNGPVRPTPPATHVGHRSPRRTSFAPPGPLPDGCSM